VTLIDFELHFRTLCAGRWAAVDVPVDAIEEKRRRISERFHQNYQSQLAWLADRPFVPSADALYHRSTRDTQADSPCLAETPLIAPFDGARPSAVTRKLFGAE
jgi:hypothetical protein